MRNWTTLSFALACVATLAMATAAPLPVYGAPYNVDARKTAPQPPVGVVGALGYVAILAAWLASRRGSEALARLASIALFGFTLFGVLFSLYLTYL